MSVTFLTDNDLRNNIMKLPYIKLAGMENAGCRTSQCDSNMSSPH